MLDCITSSISLFNLKRAVGQGEVCVCGGAGQGATTRNSPLFQGVATAMRRHKCAIHPVAWLTQWATMPIELFVIKIRNLTKEWSGQLLFLGSILQGEVVVMTGKKNPGTRSMGTRISRRIDWLANGLNPCTSLFVCAFPRIPECDS
ncbi:MAG: hypothetical protein KZQ86_20825 [Candidatus Thiodiazotropha sp. (ex Lucinoma kastoroae)]|nr:hypothetical protein [Candidatus Thiodiazotropha sp. (ex Lucinoma kastoroae)]